MRTPGWHLPLALLVLSGGSCSSSLPLGDTGLPEQTPLAALSADDWQVFCKTVDAARRKPPEEDCRRSAFSETRGVAESGSDADVQATCQARYDACMREFRPPRTASTSCVFGPVGPDCMATVGEGEQCLMAGIAQRLEDSSKVPSCATVTAVVARASAGTLGSSDSALMALPACQNFQAKCPGLIR
jgi:hypothetical protein